MGGDQGMLDLALPLELKIWRAQNPSLHMRVLEDVVGPGPRSNKCMGEIDP